MVDKCLEAASLVTSEVCVSSATASLNLRGEYCEINPRVCRPTSNLRGAIKDESERPFMNHNFLVGDEWFRDLVCVEENEQLEQCCCVR